MANNTDKINGRGKGSRRHPLMAIGAGAAAFAVSGTIAAGVAPVASANNAVMQGSATGPAVSFVPDNPPPGAPGPAGPGGPPGPPGP